MDLIDAAIKNNVVALTDLLSKNVDPNTADDYYNVTPLHYAALYGSIAVAQLLINSGAQLNAVTYDGFTPLDLARIGGNEKMIYLLLEASSLFSERKEH